MVGKGLVRRVFRPVVMSLLVLTLVCCEEPESEFVGVIYPGGETAYSHISTESIYLTMEDGTQLAVDAHLPQPLNPEARVPAIVAMTRYWRATEEGERWYLGWRIWEAAKRGFAFVVIDERGTGASFGTWPYPWSETSMLDFSEVVDWVVAQEWSNGRVGAWGPSYLGMTAQLLLTTGHPAVRASVPAYTQFDLYTDIAFPGGIMNDWFLNVWTEGLKSLDRNEGTPGVRRVDADRDGSLLAEAVAQHAENGDVYLGARSISYRDEVGLLGISLDDISAHTQRARLEQHAVPIYHWGGWLDGAGAHSVLSRFMTLSNPQQAVIGAWVHGGWTLATPYAPPGPPVPSEAAQWQDQLDFIELHVKGSQPGMTEKVLHYYTMGSETWRTTDRWPVEGTTLERWYFQAGSVLSQSPPSDANGRDTYAIDFTATTGTQTRWHTPQDGVDVVYPDRRSEDLKLLSYTSPVLSRDLEITGYPVVTLHVSSTHTDGAFFVYLEDVEPSGKVTYITEGQLRALHRQVSDEPPPYEMLMPYHSFEEADAMPLVPGEVTEIRFGLLPTSVLIQRGHRIRVAIAGHDDGIFERIPPTGNPTITVERNSTLASMIELPVVRELP